MIILSGIQAGRSGVGRLNSYLLKELSSNNDVHFILGANSGDSLIFYLKKCKILKALKILLNRFLGAINFSKQLKSDFLLHAEALVFIHPQSIGYGAIIKLLEKRKSPSWFYLVDSSFFCIKSYNYISGEPSPCLKCLGGDYSFIEENNCKPFPYKDTLHDEFYGIVKKNVDEGNLKFFVQTISQDKLLKKHFGESIISHVVGLWTSDFDEILEDVKKKFTYTPPENFTNDFVFHGHYNDAKGLYWALNLAKKMRNFSFFFPFSRKVIKDYPGLAHLTNCSFIEMSWETGLKKVIESSKIVLCPSLWSATIEGALIKSIFYSNLTAVVENNSAFSSEVPNDIVLKIPYDIDSAADLLNGAILSDNFIDREKLNYWIENFLEKNSNLPQTLYNFSKE